MPPLPPQFDEGTLASISTIERRVVDLKDFQIPRLKECRESLGVQQQYAAELRDDLEGLAGLVEALDESVHDQRGDRMKRDLRGIVEDFRERIAQLRKESRAAMLTSKRAIDVQSNSLREELLRSSAIKEKHTLNEKSPYVLFDRSLYEDALMKANNDVTDALRRTMTLMQGELERSVLSTQMLESSTATLKSASSTHDVLTNLMGTSKQLITALEKSDWIDRMLIISGLIFFFLVVGFILKQRIFDRGLRIALWWTRFLPSFGDETSAWDMADVIEKGSMSLQSEAVTGTIVSTVAASVSSVAAVVSGTSSLFPEQIVSASGTRESAESLTTASDLSPSLSQVLETTFSGAESVVSASPSSLSSTSHDEF
ncbi:Sec20-domain-containing protein [Stereum hirsutum FP-91666 SS1]|uniref:Sec20-domain-containing protein n=1 Tax=Stereum hirsutum (strain FP-91666) TaxID=721885 RepID=UPI000440B607|nr:Sec20-domain-containing protein [Stereum hirsutum FP-91666 SS1]EIM88926.1 Sec20-domain-containing protein [Stereum hirsutum FP-91666 SS1]